MSLIDEGGAAFPRAGGNWHYGDSPASEPQAGMSLRDYFAAQFIASLMAPGPASWGGATNKPEIVAHYAYLFADAMLQERSK